MTSIAQALSARLLGGNVFSSESEVVNNVLTLQFRVHYHAFGLSNIENSYDNLNIAGVPPKIATVLLNDCEKLLYSIKDTEPAKPLLQKILHNCMGILYFHDVKFDKAILSFHNASTIPITLETYKDFNTYLNLENLFYKNNVNGNTFKFYYEDLMNVLNNEISTESSGLTMHVLMLIVNQFKSKIKDDIKSFYSSFESDEETPYGLLSLIAFSIFKTNKELNLDEYFLSIGNEIISNTKFPNADETNNAQLQQFLVFLTYYFKDKSIKNVSTKWKQFLISSIGSTFQSIPLARAAMIYFGKFGESNTDKKELILNFNNFNKYSNREVELKGENNINEYPDIISLIDAYSFILNKIKDSSEDIENIFSFDQVTNKLSSLLKEFYNQNYFNFIDNNDASDWTRLSTKLNFPGHVKSVLINAWTTLHNLRENKLEYLSSNNLSLYIANALCLVHDKEPVLLSDLQFQYAYTLAQQRQLEPAIKFLKNVTLEKFPEHYRAWHLLALCESAMHEDKETPFKIICSVLEAMKECFDQKKLSNRDRWQYIQLKLTQLIIIEEIFGTMEALEVLPEVLELYASLFTDNDNHSYSIGPHVNQTKEYLLQCIWIFAANMYMNVDDEHLEQASDAVTEAIKVTEKFTNLNCNITKANLLLSKNSKQRALKEFEYVLHYDKFNVDAILGFASIVTSEDKLNEESNQFNDYYSLEKSPEEKTEIYENIFANEKDLAATLARLKYLLEYSTEHYIEAYFSAEIWWYLSLIYEKFDDKRYKESLLNCIRFKEATPIRNFKVCNY